VLRSLLCFELWFLMRFLFIKKNKKIQGIEDFDALCVALYQATLKGD
jgi:hypothetical protein